MPAVRIPPPVQMGKLRQGYRDRHGQEQDPRVLLLVYGNPATSWLSSKWWDNSMLCISLAASCSRFIPIRFFPPYFLLLIFPFPPSFLLYLLCEHHQWNPCCSYSLLLTFWVFLKETQMSLIRNVTIFSSFLNLHFEENTDWWVGDGWAVSIWSAPSHQKN